MLQLSEQHDSLAFPLVFAPEFMNIDHIMSSLLRSGAQVYPHPVGSELPLSNLQAHLCPEHGYRLTLHKACFLDLALGNWYDHFWIHFPLLRCYHSFPLFLHSEKPVYLTCVKKKVFRHLVQSYVLWPMLPMFTSYLKTLIKFCK